MRIKAEVQISRSPEDVFDYLTDFTHLSKWAQGVRRATSISDGVKDAGARYRIVGGGLLGRLENTYEVTAQTRPRSFTGRNEGLINFEEVYELIPEDGGTHIRQTANVSLPGAAGLLSPILRMMLTRQLAGDFSRLKRVLEASQ